MIKSWTGLQQHKVLESFILFNLLIEIIIKNTVSFQNQEIL